MIGPRRRGVLLSTVLLSLLLLACGSVAARPTPTRRAVLLAVPTAVSTATVAVPSATVTVPASISTVTPVTAASPSPSPSAVPTATPTPEPTRTPVTIPTPPPRDLVDLRRRLGESATPESTGGSPGAQASPDYPIGTDQSFWVANQLAKSYFRARARIVAKTAHAYWYLQDGLSLPPGAVQSAAAYFENHTYPTEHQLFGSEWSPGIDGDVHITILLGRIPGVGGYYSTADEYSRSVNPYSNQREMIYLNVDAVQPATGAFNAVVAHEFMHMIQFNVQRWQNSWVDEGSAELAAQAVTGQTSNDVGAFERQPETQLNAWASEPSQALPHYGAAYLFMRYVAEQYGGFRTIGRIVAEPERGMASFQRFFQTLRPALTFDDVFANWVAANALDDPSLDHGRFGYRALTVTPLVRPGPAVGGVLDGVAHQFGADYYQIQPSGPATIVFHGTPMVKLIGADPHGSRYEWWSNRGDSIDSRLTRSVDLRGVRRATLRFWIWYDVEKDFDYGYVEVSTDGGRTWRTLPATDTTTTNPNGQNYGNAFTGTSGGATPRWEPEVVDLSPYTGRRVLLRFEYVTDDSYNADGIAIDGVEIPEIGFHDSTRDDDGWTAEGFVRIDNRWPESYLVEVLSRASAPAVQRLQLDARQEGSLHLASDGPSIVAVAGLAPLTTHTTPFELSLRPG